MEMEMEISLPIKLKSGVYLWARSIFFSSNELFAFDFLSEEIDNLSQRCKGAESVFGSLTQSLGKVPDPATVLATTTEQIQIQQKQLGKLQQGHEHSSTRG